jgi:hypothetical protein
LTDAWDGHQPAAGRRGPCHAPHVRLDGSDRRHHGGPRGDQPPHCGRKTRNSFASFESLVDEGGGERAREPDPEHDREASDLVFQGHSLADQILACDDPRAECVSRQRLHMHRLEETGAGQMRQPSSVVAVGLVGRERLERLIGLPALDADHGEAEVAEPMEQDRRHATRFEHDATTTRRFRQLICDCLRGRLRLAFVNHRPFAVEDADMRLAH